MNMEAKLYKRLETCDAEQSWEYVRDIIAIQLMGDTVFPVPFLRDATSFDIGHVIFKGRRSKLEKLTGIQSTALPVGQLSNFVPVDPENLMQRLGNVKKSTGRVLNQAYEFFESDMKFGVKKEITVQLWGCEKWAMEYEPKPGDITVDLSRKGYVNIDRIFLITEVFYVTDVKIHLTIGKQEDTYLIRGHIPIGFSMVKYKLHKDGTLKSAKKVNASTWRAKWIRNLHRDPDDPLPLDPSHMAGHSSHTNFNFNGRETSV